MHCFRFPTVAPLWVIRPIINEEQVEKILHLISDRPNILFGLLERGDPIFRNCQSVAMQFFDSVTGV